MFYQRYTHTQKHKYIYALASSALSQNFMYVCGYGIFRVNNNAQIFNAEKSQHKHTRTRALTWPINSVSINMAGTGRDAAFTRIRQILGTHIRTYTLDCHCHCRCRCRRQINSSCNSMRTQTDSSQLAFLLPQSTSALVEIFYSCLILTKDDILEEVLVQIREKKVSFFFQDYLGFRSLIFIY